MMGQPLRFIKAAENKRESKQRVVFITGRVVTVIYIYSVYKYSNKGTEAQVFEATSSQP